MIEQGLAEPHADDMGDDERRDAQAEHELQRLDRFPAKLPALVERPNPSFPFTRLVQFTIPGKATRVDWERMTNTPGLAQNWQQRAMEILARQS